MKLKYALAGVAITVLLAGATFAYAGCPFCW